MGCEYCEIVEGKKNIIYEDEKIVAVVPQNSLTKGHIKVIPKKHFESMQDIDDKEIEHLYYAASFAATSLFENLQAEGTNIIANTGGELKKGEHFHIDVLARKGDDDLNFLWTPQKHPEEELKAVAAKIKDKCDLIQAGGGKREVLDMDKKEVETVGKPADKGDEKKEPEERGVDEKEGEKAPEKAEEAKDKKGEEPVKAEPPSEEEQKYKGKKDEKEDITVDDENYLVKQLRRIP
jgi:histidine triad (HIT) family protein